MRYCEYHRLVCTELARVGNLVVGCLRKRQMNQPSSPQYLPPVNSQLEYQAELLSDITRTKPKAPAMVAKPRPWLGTDFTHIIVAR